MEVQCVFQEGQVKRGWGGKDRDNWTEARVITKGG